MKRIACIMIVLAFSINLIACSNVDRTSIKYSENTIMNVNLLGSWGFGDSIAEMTEQADLIVKGKVLNVSDAEYVDKYQSNIIKVILSCNEVFKGEGADEVEFETSLGYIPYSEYKKGLLATGNEDIANDYEENLSAEQKENGVVLELMEDCYPIETNQEYIVFLRWEEENNRYFIIGSYQGLMKIDGESISRKSTIPHEFNLNDVLEQLRGGSTIADDNKREKDSKLLNANENNENSFTGVDKYKVEISDVIARYTKVQSVYDILKVETEKSKKMLIDAEANDKKSVLDTLDDLSNEEIRLSDELESIEDKLSEIKMNAEKDSAISESKRKEIYEQVDNCINEVKKIRISN